MKREDIRIEVLRLVSSHDFKIDPKQTSATVRGLHVTSQLGATQIDTKKVVEICLPATSPEAGVTGP